MGRKYRDYGVEEAASIIVCECVRSGKSTGWSGSLEELEAVEKVKNILLQQASVGCTACRYCTEVCPQSIPIPELFSCLEEKRLQNWVGERYRAIVETAGVKACDCLGCGACETACPQHLPIRKLLEEVTASFEK